MHLTIRVEGRIVSCVATEHIEPATMLQQHVGCFTAGNAETAVHVGTFQYSTGIRHHRRAIVLSDGRGRAARIDPERTSTINSSTARRIVFHDMQGSAVLQQNIVGVAASNTEIAVAVGAVQLGTGVRHHRPAVVLGDHEPYGALIHFQHTATVDNGLLGHSTTQHSLNAPVIKDAQRYISSRGDNLLPSGVDGCVQDVTTQHILNTGIINGSAGYITPEDVLLSSGVDDRILNTPTRHILNTGIINLSTDSTTPPGDNLLSSGVDNRITGAPP